MIPTLVATMAAPTKIASFGEWPHASSMLHPNRNGTMTRLTATSVAVPPSFMSSDDFTSKPTRNNRTIAPNSESADRSSFGAIQFSALGPIPTPARISPTMPGCPKRSKASASSFAEAKTISIASGILAGTGAESINRASEGTANKCKQIHLSDCADSFVRGMRPGRRYHCNRATSVFLCLFR